MSRQELLRLASGLEPAHLPFPLPGRLMGVLDSVVGALTPAVLHASEEFLSCSTVASELVGHQRARHVTLLLQQLAEKSLGRFLVALALEQDIQDLCVLVNRPEQVVPLTTDGEEHLVHVPPVTGTVPLRSDLFGEDVAELAAPTADGLVTDGDAALGQHLLDITVAKGKAKVEPDGMTDDGGWEAMALVAGGSRVCVHGLSIPPVAELPAWPL